MQRMRTFLKTASLVTLLGLATLALPLPAHAWVRIGVDLPLPAPVVVAPAPPVVVPLAPIVVRPGYYGPYGSWHPYRWYRWYRWVRNVSGARHPNLAAAQRLSQQAWQRIVDAQQANEWDLQGHAQKAKELLDEVNKELKLAAEAANRNAR